MTGRWLDVANDGQPNNLWLNAEILRRAGTDGSYTSAADPRVVFGLGDDPAVRGVRVEWPGGSVEDFTGLETGRYHTLRQGEGRRPR